MQKYPNPGDMDTPPIVFEGVAYKDNCKVPIIEESQKLVIAEALARHGFSVAIRDIPIIIDAVKAEYGGLFYYHHKEDY